jgi:hypothetical protein
MATRIIGMSFFDVKHRVVKRQTFVKKIFAEEFFRARAASVARLGRWIACSADR